MPGNNAPAAKKQGKKQGKKTKNPHKKEKKSDNTAKARKADRDIEEQQRRIHTLEQEVEYEGHLARVLEKKTAKVKAQIKAIEDQDRAIRKHKRKKDGGEPSFWRSFFCMG